MREKLINYIFTAPWRREIIEHLNRPITEPLAQCEIQSNGE